MSYFEDIASLMAQGITDSREIAKRIGASRRHVRRIKQQLQHVELVPFNRPTVLTIDELLEDRKKRFSRLEAIEGDRKLISIPIKIKGPIAIAHIGDPHIDDDGTDIATLEKHINIINSTEGLFAATVGDMTNNWVGRLARLYGQQSTSSKEAWQLAEWLIGSTRWLYIIGGNHDLWSGDGDPLKWITQQHGALYEGNQARIELIFPNDRRIRINARHSFRGHSIWNPVHSVARAAQMGWRDHILTAGHKHISGYNVIKCPATGLLSHCIQIATYKKYDGYAKERGYSDLNISPCAVTIINPNAQDETDLVHVMWNMERAADYLNYLRQGLSSK